MKIAAVDHAVPSTPVTNEWIIRQIREHNAGHLSRKQLSALEDTVSGFLTSAGTETRYRLADDEKAIDFVVRAGRDALATARLAPEDIDFLIYTGVGRGWIEPAMATAVQAELKLVNATCFDILDACASWLRGLHVASGFIGSGTYRRGLIVNAECGLYRAYADWVLGSDEAAEHRLATYTIGEAATATVITDENRDKDWYFTFKTFPEHFRLCMLPLPSVADFWSGPTDDQYVPGKFFARSKELLTVATRKIVEVFESDPRLRQQTYDICFGHNPSEKACEIIGRKLGLETIFFPTHRSYGNTVSASVPLAMSLALREGKLKRGDKVLIIVGSAGITVGFATFIF